jgi:hypothetical protein
MSESEHQQQLFAWLDIWKRTVPEFARTYHVPNGGELESVTRETKRGIITYSPAGKKRKAEGVRPGILDLANHGLSAPFCLLGLPHEDDECFRGLFIELKVRDAEPTDNEDDFIEWDQKREIEWLRQQGHSAHVVWSWAEAAALHAWYFDVSPRLAQVWKSIGPFHVYLLPRLGGHDLRCGCGVNLEEVIRLHV